LASTALPKIILVGFINVKFCIFPPDYFQFSKKNRGFSRGLWPG